jgi:phage-related protein
MEGTTRLKKILAAFYQTGAGREPVREWLRALDADDRKAIGEDIATVEYGWPVGMPTCRPLGKGLWEVRSTLANNRIARVIFGIVDNQMVLLHGLIKKSQKTPDKDLSLARERLKETKK